MKKYLLKFQKFLFKNYYKNIPKEFQEFTLLISVTKYFEHLLNENLKLKKDVEKYNSFFLKENLELKEKIKKLNTKIEILEQDSEQVKIQINRLKNLKHR